MYGDETEIVFINSMKDSFEKCCRFTSITNLHDKYGHGNKLIYPILFEPYYMSDIDYGPYSFRGNFYNSIPVKRKASFIEPFTFVILDSKSE